MNASIFFRKKHSLYINRIYKFLKYPTDTLNVNKYFSKNSIYAYHVYDLHVWNEETKILFRENTSQDDSKCVSKKRLGKS